MIIRQELGLNRPVLASSNKGKLKFTLEQATKAQRGRCIDLIFL
jgi:hypothetical protein